MFPTTRALVCALSLLLGACTHQIEKQESHDSGASKSTLEERAQLYWQSKNVEFNKSSLSRRNQNDEIKRNNHRCSTSHSVGKKSFNNVSLEFFEADLREVIIELSLMVEFPIVVDDSVEGLITVNIKDTQLFKALNIILSPGNYSYRVFKDYILIGSSAPDSATFSSLAISCRYKPLYEKPLDLAASLAPFYQQYIRVPANADFLTITAPIAIQNRILKDLKTFDIRPGQVLLEMSIVEVSRKALDILGVSWQQFGRDPNTHKSRRLGVGEWNGIEAISADDIVDAFTIGALPQRTLADSLQFLTDEGQANLKAMPAIVALDGNEAVFATTHTRWLPFATETTHASRTRELVYGVDMKVVPRIADNGEITLRIVNASVSDLTHTQQGMPHVISHQISSSVSIRDGDTLVLGGLLQSKRRNNNAGIPTLKDAPITGKLFGQDQNLVEEMEVLIMIRPRILNVDRA